MSEWKELRDYGVMFLSHLGKPRLESYEYVDTHAKQGSEYLKDVAMSGLFAHSQLSA